MRPVLIAACAGLSLLACAHGPTNEQRLESAVVAEDKPEAGELRCRDTSPEISIARDRAAKRAERLARYQWAITDAKSTSKRFDDAFKKDPDLIYGPDAEAWRRKQSACVELAIALEREKSSLESSATDEVAPARVAAAPEAPKAKASKTSSADEAFEDDTDELRSKYKKKAKLAKAKKASKKKGVKLAAR